MNLAIHHRDNSFSDRWIQYCDKHQIPYKLVDCYQSDIIEQMKDCVGLMWHWAHWDHKAQLFARQLTYSLEMMGKKVFPDSRTCWHYDDKLGQKYLLEAIDAPLVPSYAFFAKQQALDWASTTSFPKVFKLRAGAGSGNVRLVSDANHAKRLIRQAFDQGFKPANRLHLLNERLWQFKRDKTFASFANISRGIGRLIIPTNDEKYLPIERNYIYFQDFIPNNDHDIRVMIIDKKAFGFIRKVREGDFRASGSGQCHFSMDSIPKAVLELSFHISSALSLQSVAIDFIEMKGTPLVVEISYAFAGTAFPVWPGYWDQDLHWHSGPVIAQDIMVKHFLQSVRNDES